MTHGAELAGAIALEYLSRGRVPAAYLAGPAINFARDLGMASVSAFGQSESGQDFVPNLANNLLGSIAGKRLANQIKVPRNIFTEQAASLGVSDTLQHLGDILKQYEIKK